MGSPQPGREQDLSRSLYEEHLPAVLSYVQRLIHGDRQPEEADAMRLRVGDCRACRNEVGNLAFTTPPLAQLTVQDIERIEELEHSEGQVAARGDEQDAAVLAASSALGAARVLHHGT
jgi:hypothetical protein